MRHELHLRDILPGAGGASAVEALSVPHAATGEWKISILFGLVAPHVRAHEARHLSGAADEVGLCVTGVQTTQVLLGDGDRSRRGTFASHTETRCCIWSRHWDTA